MGKVKAPSPSIRKTIVFRQYSTNPDRDVVNLFAGSQDRDQNDGEKKKIPAFDKGSETRKAAS